jgi:hypothetical protein
MKKLLAIAILGLSTSGLVLADEIGDFSFVKPTMGVPYDGQTLGRAGYPEPVPTVNIEAITKDLDWAENALEANG